MISLQKWKCSWSLVATIASMLALVSVVHLFLYPSVSPLDYLNISQAQNSCLPVNGSTEGSKKYAPGMESDERKANHSKEDSDPQPMIDLNVVYPADLHNAVAYRGAPWKSEIGRWLSGCDSNAWTVAIVEKIGGKSCKNECSGQGICNRDLGECCCFHGFSGGGCSERLQLTATILDQKRNHMDAGFRG